MKLFNLLRRKEKKGSTMATKRPRIGHRLLIKMGLRKSGFSPKFDDAHEKYTYLKHYVEEFQESLSNYAQQVRELNNPRGGGRGGVGP